MNLQRSSSKIKLTRDSSWARARVLRAVADELAPFGLTIDSPRELWPEGTFGRAAERLRRDEPRPS